MRVLDHEQNSPEWKLARLGMPSASCAEKLITPTGKPSTQLTGYATKLAECLYAEKDVDDWKGNKYTDRGHEFEPTARAWLEYTEDADIEEVGFCLDNSGRYGCSPDGIIEPIISDGLIIGCKGLVEIKCKPEKHTAAILTCHKTGKPPTEYVPQMAMQMLVTGAEYCLLCYYHPDLPKVTMRIERDRIFEAKLLTKLHECLETRDSILNDLQSMAA